MRDGFYLNANLWISLTEIAEALSKLTPEEHRHVLARAEEFALDDAAKLHEHEQMLDNYTGCPEHLYCDCEEKS